MILERERERVPKTDLHFLIGLSIIVNFVMSWRRIWPAVDEGWWWRLGIRVIVWVEERDIKVRKMIYLSLIFNSEKLRLVTEA